MSDVNIFVQGRMSSSRFPGKMLAPFRGRPLVANLLDRLAQANLRAKIVFLTSIDPTDDPLADFVDRRCDVAVYRGELENVAARFQSCLNSHSCEWFVRISGDSPLMSGALVERMIELVDPGYDIVSNVVRRTFPFGQSVECVRSASFSDQPSAWRVRSVICKDARFAGVRTVVDCLDDLRRLESIDDIEATGSLGDLARLES
ncbi:MAG: NTP transferase domain-containing protein [Afipia sp.]|nr:NTP transferase domain-containing protein [Afipia sp.]